MRTPVVEAEQDGSIRIQDLTKVVMAGRRLGLAEKQLVPFEAARNVAHADDRPCAFHRISPVGLTLLCWATAGESECGRHREPLHKITSGHHGDQRLALAIGKVFASICAVQGTQ